MASLYIHIPFCLGKCSYCSFNSCSGMETLYSRYVKALKKEIVEHFFAGKNEQLDTLFFGGGTPTVLSSDQLVEIITCCREYLGIAQGAEISIEVNPKTADFMKLLQLHEGGVNRISIGVQSFLDAELERIGRLHDAQQGWDTIRDSIGAGFGNISIDLMYGLPEQSVEEWKWSLETALSLNPSHLSLYQLTIEENTPFGQMYDEGKLLLPGEDEILEMDRATMSLCSKSDLEMYEISNFAVRGFECRHNLNYWHNHDYLAIGAGAVGCYRGERSKNIRDPLKYCEAVESGDNVVEESEKLAPEASFRESVVIGLRMTKGVSYSALQDRYGLNLREYYGTILDPLLKNGFVEFTSTHFRLTRKGRPVANQIMAELV